MRKAGVGGQVVYFSGVGGNKHFHGIPMISFSDGQT